MVTTIAIISGVILFIALAVSVATPRGGSSTARSGDPERLLALKFRGVVVENERVAHAFDAGYSCRVKIDCDDGTHVTMTTSVNEANRFPVGSRVVKRAGTTRPEPDTEPG
jgi:hypothetical protein